MFKVVEKINWKMNNLNNMFDLVYNFKEDYISTVKDIGKVGNSIYFDIDNCCLYFEKNSQGTWFTLECSGTKEEFDEKYEYIFNKIEEYSSKL